MSSLRAVFQVEQSAAYVFESPQALERSELCFTSHFEERTANSSIPPTMSEY